VALQPYVDFNITHPPISELAEQIETLSHQSLPPNQFLGRFIELVTLALDASAGAIWVLRGDKIALIAGHELEETGLTADSEALQTNHRILRKVVSTSRAIALRADGSQESSPPTNHGHFLAPLL